MIRQHQHPLDHRIDVGRRKLRLMLLGEIQQLPDDFLYPVQPVLHRRQILLAPGRGDGPLPEVVEAVQDTAQRIIDLVGHSGRELADGRQLLRVPDLLLQLLRLGHIAGDAEHAENLSLDAVQRRHTHHNRPGLARAGDHLDLVHLLLADIERTLEPAPPVPFREQDQVGPADEIVFPIPPGFNLTVDVSEPLFGVQRINDIVCVFEQILQILLGLLDFLRALPHLDFQFITVGTQLALHPLPVGDVAELHHNQRGLGSTGANQIHFHRRLDAGRGADGDLMGGDLPLPARQFHQ